MKYLENISGKDLNFFQVDIKSILTIVKSQASFHNIVRTKRNHEYIKLTTNQKLRANIYHYELCERNVVSCRSAESKFHSHHHRWEWKSVNLKNLAELLGYQTNIDYFMRSHIYRTINIGNKVSHNLHSFFTKKLSFKFFALC